MNSVLVTILHFKMFQVSKVFLCSCQKKLFSQERATQSAGRNAVRVAAPQTPTHLLLHRRWRDSKPAQSSSVAASHDVTWWRVRFQALLRAVTHRLCLQLPAQRRPGSKSKFKMVSCRIEKFLLLAKTKF